MNKMDWTLLREEIKNKTEEEMRNEMDSLFEQIPIGGEFVKERMKNGNLKENYRLLREFLNCENKEFENIEQDLVLLKNGKEIKIGDSIYSYNTGWTIYIGIKFNKPYIIYLNKGIGFNPNRIDVDSVNDAAMEKTYEIRKRNEIPTDLHYPDMRGYKTKCSELYKNIKKYYGYEEKKKMLDYVLTSLSYEELSNYHNWNFNIDNEESNSWYGDCCITDTYTRVILDTGFFKYSEKFINDTYGYRY